LVKYDGSKERIKIVFWSISLWVGVGGGDKERIKIHENMIEICSKVI